MHTHASDRPGQRDPTTARTKLLVAKLIAVPAASSPDRATTVFLVLSAAQPGRYGFRGLAIDYRVGPFTFRATQYVALDSCIGPFTAGHECATGE